MYLTVSTVFAQTQEAYTREELVDNNALPTVQSPGHQ